MLVLVLLGVLGLAVRFVELDTNPPGWLSHSAALYIDEGYKLHSARNQILFGATAWSDLDEYERGPRRLSIFSGAAVSVMRRFGVRLQPVRLMVALLGSVSVVGLAALIGRRFGWRWGVGAASFLALDFVHVMFSRRALLEVPQALWAIAVMGGLLVRGPIWMRASLALAGFALAYLTKASAVLWIAAIIPGLLVHLVDRSLRSHDAARRNRCLGQLFLGIVLAVLMVYVLQFLMPHGFLERDLGDRSHVADPGSVLTDNLLSTLSRHDPILVAAGLISSAFLLARPLAAATPAGWVVLGSWGLFGHLALMLLNYNPLRYHLFLVPVYLGATVVFACDAGGTGLRELWAGFPRWARRALRVVFFYAGASAAGGLCHLLGRRLPIGTQIGLTPATSMIVGIAVAAMATALFRLATRDRGEWTGGRLRPGRIAAACVLLSASVSLGEMATWWAFRSRSISEAGARVAEALPPGAIVAGPWAPMLCFESPARTLYLIPGLNESSLPRIRPTHFLFVSTDEGEYIRDLLATGRVPGLNDITSILRAPIDARWHVILYSIQWEERRGMN
jgi:hypothetical protein